jgi:hypothetical protein
MFMNTYTTTITRYGRKIQIQADYSYVPAIRAIRVAGGEVIGPAEPAFVEIHAVLAKLRGKWFGYVDRLTDEQWVELERKILESVQEGL